MQTVARTAEREVDLPSRELGRLRGDRPGPTLIAVAGIHGNEPAGVAAARRVFGRLGRGVEIAGELVAFAGNLAALRLGKRYQARDLNRAWREERVAALLARGPDGDDAEDREQRELLAAIDAVIQRARGDVFVVDLHTTSASGTPFVLFGDTLRQRRFARALPLPLILGLEEQVDGVLSQYFTRRGCVTLAIEGGQHVDAGSIDNLEAALWLAARSAGILGEGDCVSERASASALLARRRGSLPHVMEVLERHAIAPSDEFVMAPGFANLAPAKHGQLLANDRRGEIRAKHDGMVILPLYQGLGDDGFFWGRAVSERGLRATEAARRLGLERALRWLPGVRAEGDALRVDARVADLYPRDVFHAFGYRRVRRDGEHLTFARQPA